MTPAYRLWDPSQAVFFAFASFFARILSDVGYAAILGIASLALWTPMGRNKSGRGLRGVMLVLIIFSLACGGPGGNVLRGRAPRRSWLASVHLLDANDQRLMMWIAIGIGAAHLIYVNLAFACWRRHSPTAISALAWAVIIPGGFSVGLATSYPELVSLTGIGLWTFAAGALLVLLFTSERPFSLSPGQLFGRFWMA